VRGWENSESGGGKRFFSMSMFLNDHARGERSARIQSQRDPQRTWAAPTFFVLSLPMAKGRSNDARVSSRAKVSLRGEGLGLWRKLDRRENVSIPPIVRLALTKGPFCATRGDEVTSFPHKASRGGDACDRDGDAAGVWGDGGVVFRGVGEDLLRACADLVPSFEGDALSASAHFLKRRGTWVVWHASGSVRSRSRHAPVAGRRFLRCVGQ
jgi:hypothetical protein